MDNFNDTLELQEMREQLSLLNKKLEKEHLLNEQMMRKAMHQQISKMRSKRWWMYIAIVVTLPCWWFMYTQLHFSMAFCIVTLVFFLLAAIFNQYIWHNFRPGECLSGNLRETSLKMVHLRRLNTQWLQFGICFIIPWFIWFVFENDLQQTSIAHSALVGGIVGGIIGGTIGIIQYRKQQKALKEMIQQIEEMTEE